MELASVSDCPYGAEQPFYRFQAERNNVSWLLYIRILVTDGVFFSLLSSALSIASFPLTFPLTILWRLCPTTNTTSNWAKRPLWQGDCHRWLELYILHVLRPQHDLNKYHPSAPCYTRYSMMSKRLHSSMTSTTSSTTVRMIFSKIPISIYLTCLPWLRCMCWIHEWFKRCIGVTWIGWRWRWNWRWRAGGWSDTWTRGMMVGLCEFFVVCLFYLLWLNVEANYFCFLQYHSERS